MNQSDPASSGANSNPRLQAVLAEYLRAVEAGAAPDRAAWLAAHPDLADELAAFLENRARLATVADELRQAAAQEWFDQPTMVPANVAEPDAVRACEWAKRDHQREIAQRSALDSSAAGLENWLVAQQSSPSERAVKNESLLALANALAELPEPQREAVTLHYLQGWPLASVANHLRKTEPAVAGLLHRGLKKLRARLEGIR